MAYDIEINMVRGANVIEGKDGADGEPGKSAYQAACDGGYQGSEAEFNALLALIGNNMERPTKTITLESPYCGGDSYCVKFCDYGDTLPVGTEIKKVRVLINEDGGSQWVDLENTVAYDGVTSCIAHVNEVFVDIEEGLSCVGFLYDDSASSSVNMAALNSMISAIEVTYYIKQEEGGDDE
ncbi:MAG: hypothetical protein J6A60_02135 [Clostridia bacterium]|nr:hypothetical protein [Clostridia bacterium]